MTNIKQSELREKIEVILGRSYAAGLGDYEYSLQNEVDQLLTLIQEQRAEGKREMWKTTKKYLKNTEKLF